MRRTATLLLGFVLAGCRSGPPSGFAELVDDGQYGRARALLADNMTARTRDRDYLLDRMCLGVVELADGRPAAAEPVLTEVFDVLRTQGINDDRTVRAAVFGERGVIYWKGEPFEQALAFHYIAVQKAMQSEWDNARAAANASLFLLQDFGDNERGGRKTTEDIAEEAYRRGGEAGYEDYLDHGYTPRETDFALGYFMAGVANLALARVDPDRRNEASDHFRRAVQLRPPLEPLAQDLLENRTNTVLIVDFGRGPEKVRYGPDGALARFEPHVASDDRPLEVTLEGAGRGTFGWACDVNAMAADHMWNNFEDVRRAKSAIGDALLISGAVVAASSDSDTGNIIGLSLLLGGLVAKLSARADVRHCEIMPQRIYVAAINVPAPGARLTLTVPGPGGITLSLPEIDPPTGREPLAVHYIRLPCRQDTPAWASGQLAYANDATNQRVPGDDMPFILGGTCVRTPDPETMRRYHESGCLRDMTAGDLRNVYHAERITIEPLDPAPGDTHRSDLHIFEGGNVLYTPRKCSTGYARLFCVPHAPYRPRSREAASLARSSSERPPENEP